MASKIIGRAACPWCDFDAAHVRESEKCLYLYCPDCGISTHFRTDRQRDLLRAKSIRAEGQQATAPAIEQKPVAAEPTPPPQPTTPQATDAPIEVPATPPKRAPRKPKPTPAPPVETPPVSVPPVPPRPPSQPASWWGVA